MANIEIRAADLTDDREALVELLLRHSTARSTEQRYRWFYEDNPHGRAEVLLAYDSGARAIIGSGAVIPRRMYVNGVAAGAAVMADFWIHPDYRSLGPAVRLQRACVERAAAMGFAFYDLPQGNMAAVYKRMGLLGDARLARFSRPLRAGPYLERIVPGKPLARLVGLLSDQVLAALDRLRAGAGSLRIERHTGGFGPEFSVLTRRAAEFPWTTVARCADYLEWRYRRHYHLDYSIFTARGAGGHLEGYAVVVNTGAYAEILDLFPIDRAQVVVELLYGMFAQLRRQGASALTISCLGAGDLQQALTRAGLRDRDSRPFIVHEFAAPGTTPPDRPQWVLTYGDIDY